MRDWMQSHAINPRDDYRNQKGDRLAAPDPIRLKHHGFLSHGINYNFVALALPGRWQQVLSVSTMRFETHVDTNSIRLGIRLK